MFPKASRVVFERDPIELVVFQVRFMPILRIRDSVTDFQDEIRSLLPGYDEKRVNLVSALPFEVPEPFRPSPETVHEFTSRDGVLRAGLQKDAMFLECRQYCGWERFADVALSLHRALLSEYEPVNHTRFGLRYRDAFQRSQLGLESRRWGDLLNPVLSAEVDAFDETAVRQFRSDLVLELDNVTSARLQHGIEIRDGENVFVLDVDFFVTEPTVAVEQWVQSSHDYANRVFHWATLEEMQRALGPLETV